MGTCNFISRAICCIFFPLADTYQQNTINFNTNSFIQVINKLQVHNNKNNKILLCTIEHGSILIRKKLYSYVFISSLFKCKTLFDIYLTSLKVAVRV